MRMRSLALVLPVAALTLVAGCGSSDETATDPAGASPAPSVGTSSPATTATASPVSHLPACASLWAAGKTLPADYAGCQDGGVKAHSLIYQCEIGSKLATYGARMYAVPGSRVVVAPASRAKDKRWKYAYAHCVG